jgi:hypothetical protein
MKNVFFFKMQKYIYIYRTVNKYNISSVLLLPRIPVYQYSTGTLNRPLQVSILRHRTAQLKFLIFSNTIMKVT